MDGKRHAVLELVKLGMTYEKASLVAECSDAEIEEMSSDSDFQLHVRAASAILERDLLKELNEARRLNASIGNTTEVRWMLERIDPARWGSQRGITVKGKNSDKDGFSFVVEFVDGTSNSD